MTTTTNFDTKVAILSSIYVSDNENADLEDLFDYGDFVFDVAFAIKGGYVLPTDKIVPMIDDLFDYSLTYLGISNTGFATIGAFRQAAGLPLDS